MTFFVICCIIAVLLAQLEASGSYKNGLKVAFILLTTISAIQFNFGRDYWNYYTFYEDHIIGTNDTLKGYLSEYGSFKNEWGWIILQLLFKPLGINGFFLMVALISVVQNVAIYKLITRYVDKEWYGLSMFLYVISNSFFVLNLTMFRQSLAISLFVLVIPYVLDRKILVPLITALVASTIHKSALILLPFVFWGWLPIKNIKFYVFIYVCIFFIQFIFPAIPQTVSDFLSSSENVQMYYRNYYDFGKVAYSYGLGFIITIMPFIIAMYYISNYPDESVKLKALTLLSSVSFVLMPMNTVFALSSRVGYYFSVFSIATIPITYKKLQNPVIRMFCIIILLALNIMSFVIFFQEPDSNNDTSSFHTIFEIIFN